MILKKITEEEKKEVMEKVKRRYIKGLGKFIESFDPLISKIYWKNAKKNRELDLDDFTQECNLIILKCLKSFEGNEYGKLVKCIVKCLKSGVRDFMKKKGNFDKRNLLCKEANYVYDIKASSLEDFSDEKIVNKLTADESYEKFIKNHIPKRQEAALIAFCLGDKAVKRYILKTGIKRDSFRKCVNRAIANVKKIIAAGDQHQFIG